ncbi:N-acetylglucosamine-6-phosphate deacetylase [Pullulanibacillus pueri]|uniref:N-acetylglucosamine-6-phosphate deacetylase n=1 Tax=Pullulanibacillus pueri TaxID=1437324 RepID=A0A8J2ZWS8_9BACL|nr:N-acetylglucosamine-6-phosphate deacetylase [Pullulanibacillus pueri]MBM7682582.1 N-acetylglucosamine-6-phosphate deacetylase [Pullulanibacillus pueri]GGH82389.1 N-acetylglucosamine-6-phosphate deacetylase [Pullulanibacillus pueri]
MSKPLLITNTTLYTEKGIIRNGSILLQEGKIAEIYAEDQKINSSEEREVINGSGLNVIPGFIDGHIHGANGADVMDATETALETMATFLPHEGTTSFLATTMTQSPEAIEAALKTVAAYQNKEGQAEIVGVHLEGPFVEKSKAGAQPQQYIIEPDLALFQKWQKLSGHAIKTITLAPEHDADGEFIRTLAEQGVNVSAGHTGTDFIGMKLAVSQGVRQVTHLCNAMVGIHHRDIGVVGAAFQLKELKGELITDGIHVSPEMMQLIVNNMGSERIIMITDSIRAKGLTTGEYDLGGQPVTVTEDRAFLEDGTLAGSILKMDKGAQNMLALEGVTLSDIIQMASINPAKQIGIFDRKGSIAVGKDADLLIVDENLTIHYTLCRGVIAGTQAPCPSLRQGKLS